MGRCASVKADGGHWPQSQRQSDFMAGQHGLPFPVLHDPDNAVAEKFGLVYTVPEYHRAYYLSILVNIPFVNGEKSWKLPYRLRM